MITNCLPYAIWVSVVATFVLVFFCMLKKGAFKHHEHQVGFGLTAVLVLFAVTLFTTGISVVASDIPTPVVIMNTRVQTFVLNTNKQLLFSLDLTGASNGPVTILRHVEFNFFGCTNKDCWIYDLPALKK